MGTFVYINQLEFTKSSTTILKLDNIRRRHGFYLLFYGYTHGSTIGYIVATVRPALVA